jgi:hypothetical protein
LLIAHDEVVGVDRGLTMQAKIAETQKAITSLEKQLTILTTDDD